MPCRGCKSGTTYAQHGPGAKVLDAADMVALKYVGKSSTTAYRGRVTGRTYRFGVGANETKYVHKLDVPGFLGMPCFERA